MKEAACPVCAALAPVERGRCTACGSTFHDPCPCGAAVPSGTGACPSCGRSPFRRSLATVVERPRTLVLVGLVLAAAGAGTVAWMRRPDAETAHRRARDAAISALHAGRASEAETMLEPLLAARPGDLVARTALAAARLSSGRASEAAAEAQRVLDAQPSHTPARLVLVRALAALGDSAGVVRVAASADVAADADAQTIAARAAIDLGRSADALAAFERADAARPLSVGELTEFSEIVLDLASHRGPRAVQERRRAPRLGERIARALRDDPAGAPVHARAVAEECRALIGGPGPDAALAEIAGTLAGDAARARSLTRRRRTADLRALLSDLVASGSPAVAVAATGLAAAADPPSQDDVAAITAAAAAHPTDAAVRTAAATVLMRAARGREAFELVAAGSSREERIVAARAARVAGDEAEAARRFDAICRDEPPGSPLRLERHDPGLSEIVAAAQEARVAGAAAEAAREALDTLRAEAPGEPAGLAWDARIALAQGRSRDAHESASRALATAPDMPGLRDLAIAAACAALDDEALARWAEKFVEGGATVEEARAWIRAAADRGRHETAIRLAAWATEQWPADEALVVLQARSLLHAGQADAAARRLVSAAGDEAREIRALALAHAGRADEAIAEAAADPVLAARAAAAAGRIDDGVRILRERDAREPLAPPSRRILAELLLAQGRRDEGRGILEDVVRTAPADVAAIATLADVLTDDDPVRAVASGRMESLRAQAAAAPGGAAVALRLEARIARARGDHALGRTLLERAAGMSPGDAPTWRDLAAARAATDDAEGALGAARRAVAAAPQWAPARATFREATVRAALARVADGRDSDARTLCDEALATDSKWSHMRAIRALASAGLADAPAAQADAERALEESGSHDPVLRLVLARALAAQGARDRAIRILESVVAGGWDGREPRIACGEIRLSLRDADGAEADFRAAAAHGADARTEAGLAGVAVLRGDDRAAITHATEAVRLDGRSAVALRMLGEARMMRGDVTGAVTAWDKSWEIEPRSVPTRVAAARALASEKRWDDALARLSSLASPSGEALALRGEIHIAAGRRDAGVRDLQAATGTYPKAWLRLGVLCVEAGDFAGAADAYRAAVRAGAADRATRLRLAVLDERAGRRDDALAAYDALLAEKPDDGVVLNNLAALLTPKGRERPLGPVDPDGAVQRDIVRAIDAARRARALLPADADVADTLGWLLWLDGDEKGARELLDEAIRTGDRADARFHLALVEIEAGRGDAARPLLRRAIEQAPTAPWAARAKELAAR